jgi:hypothetical protein
LLYEDVQQPKTQSFAFPLQDTVNDEQGVVEDQISPTKKAGDDVR